MARHSEGLLTDGWVRWVLLASLQLGIRPTMLCPCVVFVVEETGAADVDINFGATYKTAY